MAGCSQRMLSYAMHQEEAECLNCLTEMMLSLKHQYCTQICIAQYKGWCCAIQNEMWTMSSTCWSIVLKERISAHADLESF